MRLLLAAAAAAALAAPAAGQRDTAEDRAWHMTLSDIARTCDDPVLNLPSPHVIQHRREAARLARAMLRADPARCPGVAAQAQAQLQARIGEPERGDVDLALVRLALPGAAADPALAARYARMLWLFDDRPPELAGWTEAEREAWLTRPGTVALLDARNAVRELRTRRSIELHSALLLRRGAPFYDPARAATLLEDGRAGAGNRARLAALLLDGEHLPPDHARAARLYVAHAAQQHDFAIEPQRELLRIGRLAAAAARTPEEQATALRIVSAAALDGRHGSAEEQSAMLRRLGRVAEVALTAGDAERIGRALDFRFAFDLPDRREDDPAELRPIRLRGLIGPDGRIVATEVAQPSGSPYRDRIVRGIWADLGTSIDLSATAQGRFVWVELPPVDPLLTTTAAFERWNP